MSDANNPHQPLWGQQPYTVILMMTDDIRSDECCAADWVRRVWVYGTPDDAGVADMIQRARDSVAALFGWDDPDPDYDPTPEELDERKEAMEPVAIFAGHIFDIYTP